MKYYHRLIAMLLGLFLSATLPAQHKIAWDIESGDTSVQRGLYKQINGALTAAPDTKIEVAFHGNAIYAVLTDTGYHKEQIMDLVKKGVVFVVCNNSLKGRNIDPKRLMPHTIIVPVAVLELVKKQEEGWAYIKAG